MSVGLLYVFIKSYFRGQSYFVRVRVVVFWSGLWWVRVRVGVGIKSRLL